MHFYTVLAIDKCYTLCIILVQATISPTFLSGRGKAFTGIV